MSKLIPLDFYASEVSELNMKMAETMFKSGLMPAHIRSPQAALYIMQRGTSLGLEPMAAIENIFLVQGRIFLGIHACQAIVAAKGGRWTVKRHSATECEIILHRPDWADLTSVYTLEDAKKSGIASKATFQQHPGDILYANAFRKGARKQYPDWLNGINIADELEVRGGLFHDDKTIDVTPQPVEKIEEKQPSRRAKKQLEAATNTPTAAESSEPPTTVEPKQEESTTEVVSAQPPAEAPMWNSENPAHRTMLSRVCNEMKIPPAWRSLYRIKVFEALACVQATEQTIKETLERIQKESEQ